MYFFDLDDYYSRFDDQDWNDYGIGGVNVGCGGGLSSTDWEDLLGTGTATSGAFFKAINEWFLASASSGCTESLDIGCSPSYLDLWVDYVEKKVFWQRIRVELTRTIYLYFANYEYRSQDPTFKNKLRYILCL